MKRLRAGDAATEAEGLGDALFLLPKRVFLAGESALTEEEALDGDFFEDALFFGVGELTKGEAGDFLAALRVFLAGESTEAATGLLRGDLRGDLRKGDFLAASLRAGECIVLGLVGRLLRGDGRESFSSRMVVLLG